MAQRAQNIVATSARVAGCPNRRIDRLCVTCCSLSQPSHHTGYPARSRLCRFAAHFPIALRRLEAYFVVRPMAPKGSANGSVRALPCAVRGCMWRGPCFSVLMTTLRGARYAGDAPAIQRRYQSQSSSAEASWPSFQQKRLGVRLGRSRNPVSGGPTCLSTTLLN
jgi:hypothetical protein